MTAVATFFSHFGAIRFRKACDAKKIKAVLLPVPRNLSSSCGTCVRFETDGVEAAALVTDEVEQIAECMDGGYRILYRAENS